MYHADRRPRSRRGGAASRRSPAGIIPSTARSRRTSSSPSPSRWASSARSPTSCSTRPARRLAEWRRDGSTSGSTINVSGRDLADRSLVRQGHATSGDQRPPGRRPHARDHRDRGHGRHRRRRRVSRPAGDLGIRIAIDDYGTGYSSLAYLHRLPVQELKLDRSFVDQRRRNDQSNSIIVRSSIAMAHSLGLSVVAEGAEDEVTCAILADAGCDAVQGYYFSPPLGIDDLLRWFATHPRLRFSHEIPSSRPLRVIPGRMEKLSRPAVRAAVGPTKIEIARFPQQTTIMRDTTSSFLSWSANRQLRAGQPGIDGHRPRANPRSIVRRALASAGRRPAPGRP